MIKHHILFVLNPGALTCGANPGSPVTDDYASPFKLTAAIHRRNGGRQRRADPRRRSRTPRQVGDDALRSVMSRLAAWLVRKLQLVTRRTYSYFQKSIASFQLPM